MGLSHGGVVSLKGFDHRQQAGSDVGFDSAAGVIRYQRQTRLLSVCSRQLCPQQRPERSLTMAPLPLVTVVPGLKKFEKEEVEEGPPPPPEGQCVQHAADANLPEPPGHVLENEGVEVEDCQ